MKNIITAEEAKTLGRPIGNNVSARKIDAFIVEVEQTIIRKSLGDSLYMRVLKEINDNKLTEEIRTLLEGGEYPFKSCKCDGNTESRMFTGLKVTEAYYVYAQNVRAGDFESTRYGMVKKDDEYSEGISSADRSMVANSTTSIADTYLAECLDYCKSSGLIETAGKGNLHTTSGCIIRKIG